MAFRAAFEESRIPLLFARTCRQSRPFSWVCSAPQARSIAVFSKDGPLDDLSPPIRDIATFASRIRLHDARMNARASRRRGCCRAGERAEVVSPHLVVRDSNEVLLMNLLTRGAAAVAVTSVCCGAVSVTAEHDPLYRAQPHTSTITAVALDADGGVATIRIEVIVGQLTACTELGGLAGLIPCRSGATVSVRECTFANTRRPAACSFPITIGAGQERLITYQATATSATGGMAATESVTYAAGTPLTQVTVTAGPEPVVQGWATARPIAWHTDVPPGSLLLANKLDIGFFPDVDFGTNYDLFIEKMEPMPRRRRHSICGSVRSAQMVTIADTTLQEMLSRLPR
jgi:hypothetical protein